MKKTPFKELEEHLEKQKYRRAPTSIKKGGQYMVYTSTRCDAKWRKHQTDMFKMLDPESQKDVMSMVKQTKEVIK